MNEINFNEGEGQAIREYHTDTGPADYVLFLGRFIELFLRSPKGFAEKQEIVRLLDGQFTVIERNEREIDTALKRSAPPVHPEKGVFRPTRRPRPRRRTSGRAVGVHKHSAANDGS
jgi:hypothetical protein